MITQVLTQLLGIPWMDPNWLMDHFTNEFIWLSLAIVFIECGLLFPFLPGDTLLFAIGIFIATGRLNVLRMDGAWTELLAAIGVLSLAAFLGNVSGYEIGRKIGPPLYERDGRIIKRTYLEETDQFFDRHGNVALVIGRFVPFVRTFITVVAGITRMERHRFFVWSGAGAVAWVAVVTLLGYFLGKQFPSLGKNLDIAILVLLALTVIPIAWEWLRRRQRA